ncbi:TetR/AcrR family transcriptional regulator [Xylophilus ampelinus]|uniref:TetR family transcriptional regulator n=1 Tax=Xylophilus ampelinus TaxID=54067 RepID=A0A318SPB8_9BURK|nr:TetR/AcrR family transcriptional regulator [Xylophilus ampelinus]MCS4509379.1 TetR/AcrR family transcriptional regulator [Xylophilus ampelinus]PYE79101.1 TetR family transcriptional regulator [Xylophilus ampelinus]
MPRGRSASYDEQRTLILERAAALFARHGYPSTSMNQVAQACELSKATLYHYYRDKYTLLVSIADGHVSRLAALVDDEATPALGSEARLRQLIHRIVEEYANARNAHRVLTEDARFLEPEDRERVLGKERRVVAAFAEAVARVRPGAPSAPLAKPLTMLLFGMVNWMFTWMKPDGALSHAAMGPIVADLFLGGIGKVESPPAAVPHAQRPTPDA